MDENGFPEEGDRCGDHGQLLTVGCRECDPDDYTSPYPIDFDHEIIGIWMNRGVYQRQMRLQETWAARDAFELYSTKRINLSESSYTWKMQFFRGVDETLVVYGDAYVNGIPVHAAVVNITYLDKDGREIS